MTQARGQMSVSELLEAIRRESPLGITDLVELRRAFTAFYRGFAAQDAPEPRPLFAAPQTAWEIAVPGADLSRTVLFFHGGGFTIGSTADHADLCAGLSAAARARVVSLDYRLAPEHPFPAAVEDAAAVHERLLEAGVEPGRLALAGISAGGTLVLTTLLKARDSGLPLPPAAVCMSPAPDLMFPGLTVQTHLATDWITPARLDALRAAYLGDHSVEDPLASPIHADLTGLPPLLIQCGGGELLLDDIRALASTIRTAGVDVELVEWPQLFHCWQVFAGVLREGREALAQAGAFLRERFV